MGDKLVTPNFVEAWEFKTIYHVLPNNLTLEKVEKYREKLDKVLNQLGAKGWVLFAQSSAPYSILERGTLKRETILSIYTFTRMK